MQVMRIVAFSAIVLAATVLSGCAAGPGRVRREAAEPLPGRLIESDEPSVVARTSPKPIMGVQSARATAGRRAVSAAPEAIATQGPLATDAVLSSANTQRRWFQGWTLDPRTIAANWKSGRRGSMPRLASTTTTGSAHHQPTSMVTQARGLADQPTQTLAPVAEPPKSPVVRASRLAMRPVQSLPVSITLRLPPRTDDDDRLASHEEPIAEPRPRPDPEPQSDVTSATHPDSLEPSSLLTEPPAIEESPAIAETPATDEPTPTVTVNGFPEPILPPDLADLDTILERTQNGDALPTIAQEVPPDPDLEERFQGRPRLTTLPMASGTSTLTIRGTGSRPVGLPARLPEPSYPEDRTRSGTMTGRSATILDQTQPQSQSAVPTTRRRGILSGMVDRLMRRESGNVAEPR